MKYLIVCLCIFFAINSQAQVQKGSFLIGPSVSYTSIVKPQISESLFSATLRLGYFVTDKIAVGIIGGTSYIHISDPNSIFLPLSKFHSYQWGVFARAYKMYNDNKIGFFGQLEAAYLTGSVKNATFDNSTQRFGDISTKGFSAALRPGVVYFMTKRLGIEAMFGRLAFQTETQQSSSNGQNTSKSVINYFNFNYALNSIQLGLNFYLGR